MKNIVKEYLKKKILKGRIFAPKMEFPTYAKEFTDRSVKSGDYFRYATLGLAIQRLLNDKIEGSFAEAGVYRGEMSKFIHQMDRGRKFFLFDTFEGFPKQDLEKDITEDCRFSDSSVDVVLANIGDSDNIVIKKGYVPDTFTGLEDEKFAFVLLDLDLYNPTKEGLEFFYPRIVRGGYLVIHDYNNSESNWACKRAVDAFMEDKVENIIEIADNWGSVIIRKNNTPTCSK